MDNFFTEHEGAINKFIEFTNKIKLYNEYSLYSLELCSNFLQEIIQTKGSPVKFGEVCKYNLKYIGDSFIEDINASSYDNDTYENVLIFLIRIAKEYELSSNFSLKENGTKLLQKYKEPSGKYSDSFNSQIYFTWNIMPFQISDFKNSLKFDNIKTNFKNDIKSILDQELPKEKEEINNLKSFIETSKKQLKDYKQEFSFINLNQAFFHLAKSKKTSKNIVLILLIILSIIIVYIPYFYYEKSFLIKEISNAFNLSLEGKNNLPLYIMLSGFIPMFLIESIFLYFFRIVLHKYNSLVDQIVQLETKQAIIQFIESYVDYQKDKNLSRDDLAKFEEIIFSKISPNLKDVPDLPNVTTIIESLSKAIKTK